MYIKSIQPTAKNKICRFNLESAHKIKIKYIHLLLVRKSKIYTSQ